VKAVLSQIPHQPQWQPRQPQASILVSGATEVVTMLIQWAQWWTLACNDVRLRYRRTTLGPLWITVGLAATVSSVGLLYGSLFGNRLSDYLPYFATGLVVWAFIASAITEGCTVYLVAARLIRAVPVPIVVHVYRMLGRQIIVLAHNFLIVALLWM